MSYQDKFVLITTTYAKDPYLLNYIGKVGLVVDDRGDGMLLVYFKARKFAVVKTSAVTVVEFPGFSNA